MFIIECLNVIKKNSIIGIYIVIILLLICVDIIVFIIFIDII